MAYSFTECANLFVLIMPEWLMIFIGLLPEFIRFEPERAISTLRGKPMKLLNQFIIPQQQDLIYWKWGQHTLYKGLDCYWKVINHMEVPALIVLILLYGCGEITSVAITYLVFQIEIELLTTTWSCNQSRI